MKLKILQMCTQNIFHLLNNMYAQQILFASKNATPHTVTRKKVDNWELMAAVAAAATTTTTVNASIALQLLKPIWILYNAHIHKYIVSISRVVSR